MRHGKKVIHLGRKTAHRKSMLANLGCSLIEHKRINTTVTKAKALKRFIEPIITKSKGLWVNSGAGHLGWTMGMALAERLVNDLSSR